MSDIDYRTLMDESGFEHFKLYKGVTSGWKHYLNIPVGTSILLNLKTLTNGVSGNLLTVSVDGNTSATITKLSGNSNHSPFVRCVTGGSIPSNMVGFEVSLDRSKDIAFEFTELGKPGVVMLTGGVNSGTSEVAKLNLTTLGFDTTSPIKVSGGEVYHPDNLPPIASKSDTLLGKSNNEFLTPYAISDIVKNLQKAVDEAAEGIEFKTSSSVLTMKSLNIISGEGVMRLPPGGVKNWLRFTVHPKVNSDNVLFQTDNGDPVFVRGNSYDDFKIHYKEKGVEYRAYINDNGKWEVLL